MIQQREKITNFEEYADIRPIQDMETNRPTIAYIAQFFPILTETFVYREVNALRRQGYNVVTLANRTPDTKKLSQESLELMDSTEYVFPLQLIPFIFAHLYFIITAPKAYFGTFWAVMGPSGESWDNRRRTLGHFGGGVYLAHRARNQSIEHIHAHFSVNAATIGLVIARLLDISYSFTVHNNIFTDRLILREKLRAAKFIISISEYSRQFLVNYAPEISDLADKISIVHCGISPEQFIPERNFSAETDHTPHIVSLSSLTERKGMPMLVEACRILRDRGIPFTCTIAGDGPQRALLEQKIGDYELENHVTLAGRYFQEDIRDYLNNAHVFALACVTASNGDVDGVPVALMEAMAMKVPTVSTVVSGIPELIDHEISGLLVPEQSPEKLANAIVRLLAD
ncbi:MAG: glycosyltransferase, partial [Candidatus Promineifilaceae bacterium]